MSTRVLIRHLGQRDYQEVWREMQTFVAARTETTPDEVWLLQHPPVYTQGQAGKPEHILNPGNIPIVQTDRGGQVTYHGPGQLVAYVLFDLGRLGIGIRRLVTLLETTIIDLLAEYNITAAARPDAPGVYVNDAKICSIGLRVRKGYSYHGLAFNIAMDLEPFSRINPCGYQGLKITQMSHFMQPINWPEIESKIIQHIIKKFRYNA